MKTSLILVLTAFISGTQADPELDFLPEVQQRAQFEAEDFALKFAGPPTDLGNIQIFPGLIDNTPALATLPGEGVGQARFYLEPCALVPPHVHPRGTEAVFAYEGTLKVGFHEEGMGRFLENTVATGTSTVIPQGLIHYVQNDSCEPAKYLATVPTRDAGTSLILPHFLGLPESVIRGTLAGVPEDIVQGLLKALGGPPALSADPQCLARCGGGSGGGKPPGKPY